MRLRFFGGFDAEADGAPVDVRGRGQEALLFRLALDAGTTVAYRALAEDVWPDDPPEDTRASLQSLASRLRRVLPSGTLEAAPGGYRLAIDRDDVDLARFADLVERARRADDPSAAAADARTALDLWKGDPWTPGEGFDWVVRDLLEDRAHAERLASLAPPHPDGTSPAHSGAADATAVDTADAAPIPAALTPLIGRRHELALIDAQLAAERLVTLIGPGGAGKTTLAFETARRRPGAVVVELAPAAPGEVWAAVAGAVGRSIRVRELVSSSARERVLEALTGRTALIVLDNCEHVSAEAASVALELLRGVPGARILATSREPLGLAGEAFVDLGPLPQGDARELFTRRVRAARGAPPAAEDAEAVERIVTRLDGLPLALELAAAKARTLTIAEIDSGLDDRFALLATGPRAIEARHQTLRALIDWSWETLTASERTALLATAVFPDGIGAGDIAVVARAFEVDPGSFDTLVDKSLLHRSERRLRMLETVREYGIDRLRGDGREAQFRGVQARAMAELAAREDARLRGPAVREGLAWFDADDENLSAALRACADQPGLADVGVRLVRASLWTWLMRERFEELAAGITTFFGATGALDSEPAVVVRGVGLLARAFDISRRETDRRDRDQGTSRHSDLVADTPSANEALDLLERESPAVIAAAAVHRSELSAVIGPLLRGVAATARDTPPGRPWPRTTIIDDTGLDDAPEWSQAFVGMMRSAIAQNSGDTATLGVESERSLATFLRLGDVWGTAFASQMRSEWLQLAGRLEEALEVADTSSAALAGLTSTADLVQQRAQSIGLLLRLGRIDEARDRLATIAQLARDHESPQGIAQAHMSAATIEIAVGDGATALQHLDEVDSDAMPSFPDQLVAWALSKRAQALVLLGRDDEAATALRSALPAAVSSGDHPIVSDVTVSIAGWLAAEGRDADARRALTAAARIRGGVDAEEPFLRALRTRLGTHALDPVPPDSEADRTATEEVTVIDAEHEVAVLSALLGSPGDA
ncbi:ATP-binding protein [Microbacterium kyungheense]|uniref:Putative ATPase n=1 Tax=Microbacterium kyungheense TaxID=1263636 RepID=A0A543EQD9_9MICO|nr:AAA family ATPase [Microbacterium kyungheense]TQM23783.1 putative ATPase [Microbacterium kyungheense]